MSSSTTNVDNWSEPTLTQFPGLDTVVIDNARQSKEPIAILRWLDDQDGDPITAKLALLTQPVAGPNDMRSTSAQGSLGVSESSLDADLAQIGAWSQGKTYNVS